VLKYRRGNKLILLKLTLQSLINFVLARVGQQTRASTCCYNKLMENQMETKELIIAVIEKDDAILMRKKPEGSPLYKETWYSFGCEKVEGQDNNQTMKDYIEDVIGIDVEISDLQIPTDGETKNDHLENTILFLHQ
jgi:hypothetical protein